MTIVAFPIHRQTRFIRETAEQIDRRNGTLAEKFWKTECNRLYGRLQVQGLSQDQIETEIDGFASAVHSELQRILWAQHHRGELEPIGGDAA